MIVEFGILAVATAFDLLIIKWKFERQRYADAIFDIMCVVALSSFMGGTLGGEIVAVIAALIISIYLIFYPPQIMKMLGSE